MSDNGKERYITYHVLALNERGEMCEPISGWGGPIFNSWGYETQEEAYQAIENHASFSGYFVLPKMNIRTVYG